jgi:hypothetical protein
MKDYQMGHIARELEKHFNDLKYTQNEYLLSVEDHNKITEALTLIKEVKDNLKRQTIINKMKEKAAK